MDIVEDERNTGYNGVCEHCKKTAKGRHVDTMGHMQESRGHFFLCFGCFAPRIKWRPRGAHAKEYWTPVEMEGETK